ncbi:MAG: VWA domain-containing protein, partial [Nitrososphaerales archaeon]
DIQETLLNVALKDPENMKISEDDIKIRVPLHKARASNVILIDKSGSMRWRYKILGAISAALGLRELLDSYYSEDQLWIVGYDQEPSVLGPGEIVNLRSYGWTDIGRALDFARGILKGEENNRNIFLLTDSEPTVSTEHQQSPLESALRAARLLGLDEIKLNIIMLDESPQLRMISSQMAALCGQASIAYVSDPLNLRDFVLESYIKGRA